jgi:hypothetical protein
MVIEWKWSNGNPYYKSARPTNDEHKKYSESTSTSTSTSTSGLSYDTQTNAINQSLDENTFFNQTPSRRETIDNKMSDREMIAQCGFNPFFQTNYVNDVVTRDMFLKPINTTHEKLKETKEPTNDYN